LKKNLSAGVLNNDKINLVYFSELKFTGYQWQVSYLLSSFYQSAMHLAHLCKEKKINTFYIEYGVFLAFKKNQIQSKMNFDIQV